MIPTQRPSETTNLEARYLSQRCGGSFDAKRADKSNITPSIKSKLFDKTTDFDLNQLQGQSNFKGVDGSTYTEVSIFGQGIDVTPYKK